MIERHFVGRKMIGWKDLQLVFQSIRFAVVWFVIVLILPHHVDFLWFFVLFLEFWIEQFLSSEDKKILKIEVVK